MRSAELHSYLCSLDRADRLTDEYMRAHYQDDYDAKYAEVYAERLAELKADPSYTEEEAKAEAERDAEDEAELYTQQRCEEYQGYEYYD